MGTGSSPGNGAKSGCSGITGSKMTGSLMMGAASSTGAWNRKKSLNIYFINYVLFQFYLDKVNFLQKS